MGLIVWLIIGLVAGAVARFVVPGRDPIGLLGTMALGLAGSLLGGFLGSLLRGEGAAFTTTGLFGSILGAIVVLIALRAASR